MRRLAFGALAILGTLVAPTVAQQQRTAPPTAPGAAIAIRAGRLVDPGHRDGRHQSDHPRPGREDHAQSAAT